MNDLQVLINGSIYTMDPRFSAVSAIALSGGRVVAVGGNELGRGQQIVDLEGRCVIPGLVDSHIHLFWYAVGLQRIDLSDAHSLDELLRRVAARAGATPAGEWVLGHGWDQERWPDRRFPTAADLDAVAPHHPVALRAKSGHALVANSLALQRCGISSDTHDPPGGQLQRGAGECPTGLLLENAMDLVTDAIPLPDAEEAAGALRGAFERAWRVGLTGVHDVDSLLAFDAYQRLHARGELGLRVVKYLPADALDHALALRVRSGLGDDWLRIGGIKVFCDGALGPRTAAMVAAYVDEPDNTGILTVERAELESLARRAAAGGLPLAVHAIGDRANRMALDVLEAVADAGPPLRQRIEHAQIVHPDDLHRFAALGVIASMQPIHAVQDAPMADRYWGERCRTAYAWRSLLDTGAALAFGSDAPVEDMNPFLGIHAAVTRVCPDGYAGSGGWYPEQRLSVMEAVHAYTAGAAWAAGLEYRAGSLTPGKWADLVVLDRNIFTCTLADIAGTRVLGTMIDGRWVLGLD